MQHIFIYFFNLVCLAAKTRREIYYYLTIKFPYITAKNEK